MSDLSDRTERELRAQLVIVDKAFAEADARVSAAKVERAKIERRRQSLRQVLGIEEAPPRGATINDQILGWLTTHGVSSISQIVNGTGVSVQAARQNLSTLTKLGRVERVSNGIYGLPGGGT